MDSISQIIKHYVWSPIVYKDGIRRGDHFLESHYCALDFDDGELTFAEATENVFADMKCVIATTKSHQREKNGITCDRFRVVIPWERPITNREEYVYNMDKLVKLYPCDTQCKDAARFFFPCTDTSFVQNDGYAQDAITVDSDATSLKNYKMWDGNNVPLSVWAKGQLRSKFPLGNKNTTCFKLGVSMCKAGLSQDEAFRLIVCGEEYGGNVDNKLEGEIRGAIKSGYRTAWREKDQGDKQKVEDDPEREVSEHSVGNSGNSRSSETSRVPV